MRNKLVLVLVLVFLTASGILIFKSVKAESRTIIVPDDYPTIAAAIESAGDGDTILVRSGNYTETLTVDKSISIVGEKGKTTKITAPASVGIWDSQTPIKVNANNVRISNLTINNHNAYGFGISVIGNGAEIIGNTVYSNTAISTRAPFTTISENNVSSIVISSYQCNISNNILPLNGYVDLEGSFNLVSGNIITGNFQGYGVLINGDSNSVLNNTITEVADGISIFGGSYNIVTSNSVTNCSYTGLGVDQGVNNTFSENDVTNCRYGAGVGLVAFNNTFYHNNFVNYTQPAFIQPNVSNYWDNGMEGNYWSNYLARYPNATEADSLGVWNTPYVLDANNTDNYPLMAPFGSLQPEPEQEPFPTLLVVAVSVVVLALVAVGVVVYLRKRMNGRNT